MRVAFADLIFSWPPNGGADADLFHVLSALQSAGVEVKLFFARIAGAEDRGVVNESALPFPAEAVYFESGAYTPAVLEQRFAKAVDDFKPDSVFATHAFGMKPHLLRALANYPLVSRYYAHELTCAKDPRRFRDGAPCPNDYLRTPDICRACAANAQRTALVQAQRPAWTVDYLAAKAWQPAYQREVLETLTLPRVLVVSNNTLREELLPYHPNVRIIPGGVTIPALTPAPVAQGRRTILMPGRADDPLKGLHVLDLAGALLWEQRQDFEIIATHYDHTLQRPWLKIAGWLNHAETQRLYQQAYIVAVPSLWHEPFGLVAVEAMAAGKPVVASRSGGLRDIVRDGDTGILTEAGDVPGLATAIARLLDDPALAAAMGARGRRVVEEEYDWRRVIERHYLPLLEELVS